MAHNQSIKDKANELRMAGFSIKEIAKTLKISVGTSSLWSRNIEISNLGLLRMQERSSLHRHKMSLRCDEKRRQKSLFYQEKAKKTLQEISFTDSMKKVMCAILFWAEGSKVNQRLEFTNSDPKMIKLFLKFLRQSYELDERKFRVNLHLHKYHKPEETLDFWSKVTDIAKTQFIKPYMKPHSGLRKKKDYMGCVTVRYYNSEIAWELGALYNSLSTVI